PSTFNLIIILLHNSRRLLPRLNIFCRETQAARAVLESKTTCPTSFEATPQGGTGRKSTWRKRQDSIAYVPTSINVDEDLFIIPNLHSSTRTTTNTPRNQFSATQNLFSAYLLEDLHQSSKSTTPSQCITKPSSPSSRSSAPWPQPLRRPSAPPPLPGPPSAVPSPAPPPPTSPASFPTPPPRTCSTPFSPTSTPSTAKRRTTASSAPRTSASPSATRPTPSRARGSSSRSRSAPPRRLSCRPRPSAPSRPRRRTSWSRFPRTLSWTGSRTRSSPRAASPPPAAASPSGRSAARLALITSTSRAARL
ncbi:hypothetical protein QBC39DRAFT_379481, partial [Podospora conica]